MSLRCENEPLQNTLELEWFLDILKREGVASYLEIGSKYGGSLWAVAHALPPGARLVAVDMPYNGSDQMHLEACVAELKARGYNATLILGDSAHDRVVDTVSKLGPFDACLIDACHLEPYVRKDWTNYGSLARIVAFHDINWKRPLPPFQKLPIEVPKVWEELKKTYRHEEIRLEPQDNGLGVLWRA